MEVVSRLKEIFGWQSRSVRSRRLKPVNYISQIQTRSFESDRLITKKVFSEENIFEGIKNELHPRGIKDDLFDEAIVRAEEDAIFQLLTDMRGKKVLVLDDGKRLTLVRHTALSGAENIVCFFPKEISLDSLSLGIPGFQGTLNKPPLKKNYFDVIIAPLGFIDDEEIKKSLPGLALSLNHMGRFILTVAHPFLPREMKKGNGYSRFSGGVSVLFRKLRDSGLYPDDMIEVNLPAVENEFSTAEKIPLILGFRAIRYQKRNKS